jgi:hypothetical protein
MHCPVGFLDYYCYEISGEDPLEKRDVSRKLKDETTVPFTGEVPSIGQPVSNDQPIYDDQQNTFREWNGTPAHAPLN